MHSICAYVNKGVLEGGGGGQEKSVTYLKCNHVLTIAMSILKYIVPISSTVSGNKAQVMLYSSASGEPASHNCGFSLISV